MVITGLQKALYNSHKSKNFLRKYAINEMPWTFVWVVGMRGPEHLLSADVTWLKHVYTNTVHRCPDHPDSAWHWFCTGAARSGGRRRKREGFSSADGAVWDCPCAWALTLYCGKPWLSDIHFFNSLFSFWFPCLIGLMSGLVEERESVPGEDF